MWIGEAIWLTIAIAGLAAIAGAFHWAFATLKWLGVVYQLYLAHRMWFAEPGGTAEALPEPRSASKMFIAGMAVTLGNPKIMMFYLALLPAIIDVAAVSRVGWVELVATMFVVLDAIDLAWVLLAVKARTFLKLPRRADRQSDQRRRDGRGCRGHRIALMAPTWRGRGVSVGR